MVTEFSILFAKIASLMFLSLGVGALFDKNLYKKIMDDTFKNTALTFFLGAATVVLSMLILNYHNIWSSDWTVVITLFGWIGLIKGIVIMAFPKSIKGFGTKVFTSGIAKIIPYTSIIIGLIFAYLGFLV
ncbi:hypothetical protein ACFLQI_00845 [Candidatus Undinarchaeota archaeon]